MTLWHENGQKISEETYKDGKKDGMCTLWYRNGKKQEETTYKDGKLISIKSWDFDGNIIEQTKASD